jgi:hypothetical protein
MFARHSSFCLPHSCLASELIRDGAQFYSLAVARCFTGVGEAAFIILAPPYIDIAAPTDKRSEWISLFYIGACAGCCSCCFRGVWAFTAVHWAQMLYFEMSEY